jgi:hypothetical protein
MGGRPLLWSKESHATCPRAAPFPTQHLNTRFHIDANRFLFLNWDFFPTAGAGVEPRLASSHPEPMVSSTTRFHHLNVTKVPHRFFLLTFTFTKKKGYPGKQGLIAIKQDLWWLGVINHAGTTKKRYRRTDDGMNGIRHSGLSTISKVDEEFVNPITATPPAPLK